MSLLSAAYMVGLVSVGLPIILHLLRRKPRQREKFPSFMFLLRTAAPRQQRNNIRKWIVLLMRCAILILLSLAFAWPFLPKFDQAPEQATVLLWDQSFSMNAEPYRSSLVAEANRVIDQTDATHPTLVGLIGDRVEWDEAFTGDRTQVRSFFDRRPSAEGTCRFERALRYADVKLQRMPARNKRIVLVTDRQLVPWQDVRLTSKLMPGTALEVITSNKSGFRNACIAEAEIDSRFTEAGQSLSLRVVVKNYMLEPVDTELQTLVNNESVDRRPLRLAPMGRQAIVVALGPMPLEPFVGEVRLLVDDDVAEDNRAYFAANPADPPRVGLIAGAHEIPIFLRIALNPLPDVTRVRTVDLDDESSLDQFQECDLLIVTGAPGLQSRTAKHLNVALLGGVSAVAVWRDSARMRNWLRQLDVRAIPAATRSTRRLGSVDFEHPVFAPFLDVRVGSFFEVLFFSPPRLVVSDNARVLTRFDDGHPAIVEMSVGQGKLFVIATEISRHSTDWPTHGSFLPFWRELLAYGSRDRQAEHAFTVSNRPLPLTNLKRITRAGSERKLPLVRARFVPRQAGGYFVTTEDGLTQAISVNVPAAESDPLPLAENFTFDDLMSDEPPPTEDREILMPEDEGKSFWWIVLAVTCALLISELVLANRTAL